MTETGQVALAGALIGAAAGAIVGSHLATVLIRWPRGEGAGGGRSRCDGCGVALGPAQLVPLLSYAIRRGRCGACGAAIDRRHPLMEGAAALVGAISLALRPDMAGAVAAMFGWWLLLIAALDADHYWLPDRLTLPLLGGGLAAALTGHGPPMEDRLIGALAGFAGLAAVGWTYRRLRRREGLGGGDPKLLAALGAWLGWQALPLILLGAGLIGLAALLVRKVGGHPIDAATMMPLGTLMAAATWPLWLAM